MAEPRPHCDYCGDLGWTVERWARVTHKRDCPYRTNPWHQADPAGIWAEWFGDPDFPTLPEDREDIEVHDQQNALANGGAYEEEGG